MKTNMTDSQAAGCHVARQQRDFDKASTGQVGRVTPCAPQSATELLDGAHGVTRATMLRNLLVTALAVAVVAFDVGMASAQPTITTQPTNPSVSLGANVTFKVTATGVAPLSYRWRFRDTDLTGATAATLALTNVWLANAGSYAVVVTDSTGSVSSRGVMLDVDATFTKITSGAVVTDAERSWSVAWGDYDNDGFIDLMVGNAGRNSLYRNNGDGTFTKTISGPMVTDLVGDTSGYWGDYDSDGFLDLYVSEFTNYKNALYRNNGDGSFTKILIGPLVQLGPRSNGVNWGDYNNDGHLDVLVAGWNVTNALFR
ncbi:MAG: VCBS repeat-containing protein, partial [Chloroflexi bacterium]|nr:VCBS repeat-containing protein [Chloroflexota bacterium]